MQALLKSAASMLLAVAVAGAAAPGTTTFVIDPDASRAIVHVDKAGLLSFAGHAHEIAAPVARGSIVVDLDDLARSTVRVDFESSALKVTGRGEPSGDVPEVQQVMDSDRVLDVARFPAITFVSREIRVVERRGNHLRIRVAGDLTLHGVTRRAVTEVSTDVTVTGITATGTLVVKQTEFDMSPVTAAGGTVRVRDEVQVDFRIAARPGAVSATG